MSQIFKPESATPPPPGFVEFLEGNDGVAVGPNASDIIFVEGKGLGASGQSTAGNLYITGNAGTNTLTINSTQAQFMTNYTSINHASSPYTVLATDYYISADPSSGAITVDLPNAPTTNRLFIIKDRTGNAAVNNITLTTPGGSVTIDGQTSYVMNSNYQSTLLLFNGSNYEVF